MPKKPDRLDSPYPMKPLPKKHVEPEEEIINGFRVRGDRVWRPDIGRWQDRNANHAHGDYSWNEENQRFEIIVNLSVAPGEAHPFTYYLRADAVVAGVDNPIYNAGYYTLPGKAWAKGKFWDLNDPNRPKALKTWRQLGLSYAATNLGCGTQALYGYHFKVDDVDELIESFKAELKNLGFSTGVILSVLNPTQNPVYSPILLGSGFELVCEYNNFAHGNSHKNYLYAFRFETLKVKEKSRAFGS